MSCHSPAFRPAPGLHHGLRRCLVPLLGVLACIVAVVSPPPAGAQPAFPSRPVTLVVPFAAGGPTDAVARTLAVELARVLGQPVDVDNRPGLGGTSATAALVQAGHDGGHTLLLHHIGMATAPTLFRQLPYDPLRDFEPLGLVADAPMVLLARPSLGLQSTRQLVAYVRANEATVSVAYAGLGAASHLCGLLLNSVLGVDLISVPYKGTGPALAHLERGGADLMCDQTTAAMRSIRDGKVRAFAVTLPQRLDVLPELPTTAEDGLAGLQLSIWHGLYAPRGTPAAAVSTLALALQEAVASPAFVSAMRQVGVVPVRPEHASPAHHRALLRSQIAKWRPILLKAGQFAD